MKRKITLITLCILGILYLQFGREPYVNNAITNSHSDGYEMNLTITMNKLILFNQEKTEQELIDCIINNSFKNQQFSYDMMGYPSEIKVTVYTNNFTKSLDIPSFHFQYVNEP